jgi:hypothetical protein
LHLGGEAVGHEFPVSDAENLWIGLNLSSDSSSEVSSLSDGHFESLSREISPAMSNSESKKPADSQGSQLMSPMELIQHLSNLSVDERTGEKDLSVLLELHRQGKIYTQTISAWLQAVDIGQLGHFLGLEINIIRAFNDIEYGSQEYMEFALVMEHVR